MPTVLELLQLTSDYFAKKGIDSPRLNAELLLSHVLGCKRLDLYLSFDKPVQESEVNRYRETVRKRGAFTPLQYIIGETDFYGITLKVNSQVLIPRPETELLVEKAITIARSNKVTSILDIGTGSGNIAIVLARELPETLITAIDISNDALNLAKENAERYQVLRNVQFLQCDILQENEVLQKKYSMIVSNPPYVSSDEYPALQKEITLYEPRIAVTDEADGYRFYRRIIQLSSSLLEPGGMVIFEMALGQAEEIHKLLQAGGFTNIECMKDYQGIERIISGRKQ